MNPEMVLLFIALQVCLAGAMILIDKWFARSPVSIACRRRADTARSPRRPQPQNPDERDF